MTETSPASTETSPASTKTPEEWRTLLPAESFAVLRRRRP